MFQLPKSEDLLLFLDCCDIKLTILCFGLLDNISYIVFLKFYEQNSKNIH